MSDLELSEEQQIKKDVSINISDLDNEMIEHPSLYVHYAFKTVEKRRIFDRCKNTLEIIEATLSSIYRADLTKDGAKTTEAQITTAAKLDPRYKKANEALIAAQAEWRFSEIAESAFVQRKDLILELARDRRKEREGQLRVLEQEAGRNAVLEGMKKLNQGGAN